MDNVIKAIVGLTFVAILVIMSFFLGLIVNIYGWGLTPKNWLWIVGGFIMNWVLIGLIQLVASLFKNS